MTHPLAGQRPDPSLLLSAETLASRYFDPPLPLKPVKNGTSGHRGLTGQGFSDAHVAAMTQALCEIRAERGAFGPRTPPAGAVPGPVVLGKDVRYASDLAERTAVEVFAGNGVPCVVHAGGRATPTPVVSHVIRAALGRGTPIEGAILTASHNPPEEGGYKSNGLDGGPNTHTRPVDEIANRYLGRPDAIRRMPYEEARQRGLVEEHDLLGPYLRELAEVVDFEVLRGVPFAASPLGGSAHGCYEGVNALHGTDIRVVLGEPDPASRFRTYDWDGRLRGDPSSPWAMKAVEGLRASLGVPFLGTNDNDADRFGGEDGTGILSPNHVLCVLVDHLCRTRGWPAAMEIGRTIGTTHMIDRVAESWGRRVQEVDVGFKWYVRGLAEGRYVLAGEESAGCSFPRRDGSPWVTEKDGIAAVLLVMEVIAANGKDIGTLYRELEARFGPHAYERVDLPADAATRARLQTLASSPALVREALEGRRFAGRAVERLVVGDGVKVVLEGGVWVLKRASGTEDIVKDYREARGGNGDDGDIEIARVASEEIGAALGLGREV